MRACVRARECVRGCVSLSLSLSVSLVLSPPPHPRVLKINATYLNKTGFPIRMMRKIFTNRREFTSLAHPVGGVRNCGHYCFFDIVVRFVRFLVPSDAIAAHLLLLSRRGGDGERTGTGTAEPRDPGRGVYSETAPLKATQVGRPVTDAHNSGRPACDKCTQLR